MTHDAAASRTANPPGGATNPFDSQGFRTTYMTHRTKGFLADQIRQLRGNRSQRAFGELIGKPQSVVSRLENEEYGKLTLQTLLDIAEKLDIALEVRFVDYPTFIRGIRGASRNLAPAGYDEAVKAVADAADTGDKRAA